MRLMATQLRTRLALLVGLAVLGILLAGISSALWTSNSVRATENAGEFTVTEQNVTYTSSNQGRTVVQTISNAEKIEIKRVGSGRFSVRTDEAAPLNRSQRSQAKRVARNNGTVETMLAGLDAYELRVEPIRQLSAEQSLSKTVNVTTISTIGSEDSNGTTRDAETIHVEFENVTTDSDAVVVDRDPEFIQDEAVVEVVGAGDKHRYSIYVDLANATVLDISERGESPTARDPPR